MLRRARTPGPLPPQAGEGENGDCDCNYNGNYVIGWSWGAVRCASAAAVGPSPGSLRLATLSQLWERVRVW